MWLFNGNWMRESSVMRKEKKYHKLFLKQIFRKFFIYFVIVIFLLLGWMQLLKVMDINNYMVNFFWLPDSNWEVITLQYDVNTKQGSRNYILYNALQEKYVENERQNFAFTASTLVDHFKKYEQRYMENDMLHDQKWFETFQTFVEKAKMLSMFNFSEDKTSYIVSKWFWYKIKWISYIYELKGRNLHIIRINNAWWDVLLTNSYFTFKREWEDVHLMSKVKAWWTKLGTADVTTQQITYANKNILARLDSNEKRQALANLYQIYFHMDKYLGEQNKNMFFIARE